ncbi:MAG: Flp pilus assembly protein CpaB [Bryobacteraceae bacterium]|nr:Flp pilus assembly protein CpaB [Bryobacteraceae bacterium]
MDRRFLTVLGVSLLFALVVSAVFYQMTARGGTKKTESGDLKDLVVAAKALGIGVTVKPADVKVVKVPEAQFPKGAFAKVEEVIDRPVISNILLDEPLMEGRLASRGSGVGIAPIIPVGMRAMTVRVNDVVGVGGFVMPGMRVDVLCTGRPPGGEAITTTKTVLQNILVLTAGTTTQPDARGQAIAAPNVTLLVTPEQAETLTLASNEGRIQLILRSGSDQLMEPTTGRQLGELFGRARRQQTEEEPAQRPRPRRVAQARPAPAPVAAVPPPPPPPPPVTDQVVVIRGNQKTVENVSILKP